MFKNQIAQIAIFALVIALKLPGSSAALERPEALRASQIIKSRMVIRKYCAPCGDTRWVYITVKKVSVEGSGYDYQVVLNGRQADLSQLYVNINGNWVNMASLIGISLPGVPEYLPDKVRSP